MRRAGGGGVGRRMRSVSPVVMIVASAFLMLLFMFRITAPVQPGNSSSTDVKSVYELQRRLAEAEARVQALVKQVNDQGSSTSQSGNSGSDDERYRRPWLTIGIPTVPRKGVDYLTPTLQAIALQLSVISNVRVVVMNNDPGQHAAWEAAAAAYKQDRRFVFLVNPDDRSEYKSTTGAKGNANVPGPRVRQQTLDVVSLLQQVVKLNQQDGNTEGYYMFMEDDFLLCPHALYHIQYVMHKAHVTAGDWLAIRVSYGLSGILLPNKDVGVFADYLAEHYERRPPDHLSSEWMAAETPQAKAHKGSRRNMAYRYNVLDHIGRVSSVRDAKQKSFPACYAELKYPIVFEAEAWSPKACPADDLWPCKLVSASDPAVKSMPNMPVPKPGPHPLNARSQP